MGAIQSGIHGACRGDELTAVVTSIKHDIASIMGELILHRWMLGFTLATSLAMLFKVLSH